MENNLVILDEILLSSYVVDNFYNEYNNNKEFKEWLDSTIPDIKKCEEREQNNPWHIYNVLGHILHSVECMNKMTFNLNDKDKRLLAYTMFFHDIGKPDSHIRRIKMVNGKIVFSTII